MHAGNISEIKCYKATCTLGRPPTKQTPSTKQTISIMFPSRHKRQSHGSCQQQHISSSSAPGKIGLNWKKIRKKLRYFRLLPNLAQRKLIDLANHLPSSSPCGLLTVTHRAFENFEFYGESRRIFVSRFCEECKLVSTNVNQIQVKQTILKDFGG